MNNYNFLPECVALFLDTRSIITFASTNRTILNKLEKQIAAHKKKWLNNIFNLFHQSTLHFNSKSFKLERASWDHGEKIKYILLYIPELFSYIEEKELNYLDLGLISSYGGYPRDVCEFLPDPNKANFITSQLVICLEKNTTITKCNLGLFERYLDRNMLLKLVEKRHNFEWLTVRANGAGVRYTEPPNTIYLNPDGKAIWINFRP